jgi:hypothetical protein
MASQASSVVSSIDDWSDIDPQFRSPLRPLGSSLPAPLDEPPNVDTDDNAEGKVSQKRTSEV